MQLLSFFFSPVMWPIVLSNGTVKEGFLFSGESLSSIKGQVCWLLNKYHLRSIKAFSHRTRGKYILQKWKIISLLHYLIIYLIEVNRLISFANYSALITNCWNCRLSAKSTLIVFFFRLHPLRMRRVRGYYTVGERSLEAKKKKNYYWPLLLCYLSCIFILFIFIIFYLNFF